MPAPARVATIETVKQLLHRGQLSRRAIARQAGVGRTLVNTVASGQWDRQQLRRAARGPLMARGQGRSEFVEDEVRRCPVYGVKYHPRRNARSGECGCMGCHLDRLKQQNVVPPCPGPHPDLADSPDAQS